MGRDVLAAVGEGPAVSALGWDYVLCAVGAGVWVFRVKGGQGAGVVGGQGEERMRGGWGAKISEGEGKWSSHGGC